jgi:hypothetical protein
VSAEQVASFIAATGDNRSRWNEFAPPSYAAALLFAAAPSFLGTDEVRARSTRLVHADQSFVWHRSLAIDEALTIDGTFTRARDRAGVTFASFATSVHSGGQAVVDAVSTFLMGDGGSVKPLSEEQEPPIDERDAFDALPDDLSLATGRLPRLARSASRLDLVRYASASGDFNPVHFDHETAVASGFPGVVVHGLLMGSWLLQLAAGFSARPDAIATAKLRFRNPLRPGAGAVIGGTIEGDQEIVTAQILMRSE